MSIEQVAVTGGSGLIGSEIIDVLNEHGYTAANLDRERGDDTADEFIQTDLLDAGQVYSSLAKTDADAVIHMGTIPSPQNDPGYVAFESNAMSSYHVLEAGEALGLETACLASSINAHGWSFQAEPPEIDYLPVDEDHPVSPRDPYGLSKYVIEVLCDGFGRKKTSPMTLATLRFPGVYTTDQLREQYASDDRSLEALQQRHDPGDNPGFSYVHVRDAATLAASVLEADYEGHETFWAVAPDSTVDAPTEDLLEVFYPGTEIRRPLSGTDGLFDVSKAQELLGWNPTRSWRDL